MERILRSSITAAAALVESERSRPADRLPSPPALASWIEASVEAYNRGKPNAERFSGFIGVARDGRWEFQRGYQLDAETQLPDAETRFRIASISKMFTAAAILQLRDQGRLSLEDAIGTFVPELGLGPAVASVRLADLLSHCSGIRDFTEDELLMETWMNPHRLDEVVATFKDLPLHAAPGTEFEAYMRVEIDSVLGLVRHTRSACIYDDVPSLIASLRATLDQTRQLDRSQYVLLHDIRVARGRNDPEFEQAVTRERAGISAEFRKIALIVSTNVGRMHVQRHMQQMGLPARVFLDEQEALRWLGEP